MSLHCPLLLSSLGLRAGRRCARGDRADGFRGLVVGAAAAEGQRESHGSHQQLPLRGGVSGCGCYDSYMAHMADSSPNCK